MSIKSWLCAATLGTLAATAAQAAQTPADIAAAKADPNGNLVGLKTENGKLAYNFIDLWFNQHKQSEAWDTYVARKGYMNHAVNGANTGTVNRTYEEEKASEANVGTGAHFDIKQIIAQGNLVFVHIAATRSGGGVPPAGAAPNGAVPGGAPAGPGGGPPQGNPGSGDGAGPRELVMVLRIKNGKVVDHWDLHVATNSNSVVFTGLDRDLP
ncbi:MAG: hypothetical protein QM718_06765 [Steroidobacteraceae bacterium]